MGLTNMVTHYFRSELEALGYEPSERDLQWSLGYCQGDGVAFAASIDLEMVGARLLKGKHRAALIRSLKKDIGRIFVATRSYGPGLPHVYVDSEVWNYDDCTALEREAFDLLEEEIKREVDELLSRLKRDGYKLLEACNPVWFTQLDGTFSDISWAKYRTFEIGRFRVEIRLVEDRDFDAYQIFDHELVKALVDGKLVVYGMTVSVLENETGARLGHASCWGITDRPELSYARTMARELVSEAVDEARNFIRRIAA